MTALFQILKVVATLVCFLLSNLCAGADDAFRGGGGEFSGLPPVELSTLPQLVKVGLWLFPPGAACP